MSHVLVLIASRPPLDPGLVAHVRNLARGGAPEPLAAGEAVEIPVAEAPALGPVRHVTDPDAVDALLVPAEGRRKRLLVADMDSTIVTGETLDELADFAGLKQEIAAITRRSMNGEIEFGEALRQRVAMLRGLTREALEKTWERVRLTCGAAELVGTMRANGATCALVSGGFTYFTARVADLAGFDAHFANTLLDDGHALTGQVAEPILDRDAKLATLRGLARERGLDMSETMAVGDGANDLDMLRAAGLGVAFHAKPIVAAEAQARVDHGSLRALLFAQGYRAEEIVGAGSAIEQREPGRRAKDC